MNTEQVESIKNAVLFLAGRCDYANEKDGAGFNRFDTRIGHELADRIATGSNISLELAHKICAKYKRQLEGAGIVLPPVEVAKAADEQRRAAKAQAQASSNGKVKVAQRGSELLLQFAYDQELVEKARNMPRRRWDSFSKAWVVPAADIALVQKTFTSIEYSPELQERFDTAAKAEREREEAKAARIAHDIAALESILPTLPRKLFEHQEFGARWLVERRFAILADDMGVGKSTTSLVAARAFGLPIIVIAPAGLRVNWLREAEAVGAEIEIYSWAKQPQPIESGYVLIGDESHYAQAMTSARTKAYLNLAKHATACFSLTGTPIKNGRPANLYPLLVASRHGLAASKKEFDKRYCAARATRWSKWDTTGASHLDELHRKTLDVILRRTKADCLDLPEKTRILRKVELSSEAQATYDAVLHELQSEYHRRKAIGEIKEADALVMLNHLRHASSRAKVSPAIELAEEILEQGNQVVLFTAFKDSAEQLSEALNAGRITGDQNAQERQNQIDDFQAGKLRAMVCTFGAGGVGITLTKAQDVILVDRCWTPGDVIQAEDRLHRIGQRNAVSAHWLQTNGLDEAIDSLLCQKQERVELVLAGKRKTLRGIGSIGDVAEAVLG